MMLGISTDSFHYKYYQLLRKIWNFEPKRDRTSLCVYTQFLFWFTVWTVLCSPAIFGGWLLLKIGRFIYKVCSWTPPGRKVIDFLDGLGMGKKIDQLSNDMIDCPAKTLLLTFFGFFAIAFLTMLILGFLIGGVLYIKLICTYVLGFLMALSLGIFYICFGFGWVLAHAGICIMVALKWIGLMLLGYGLFFLAGLAMIAAMGLVGMIFIKLLTASERITNFFGFKLNGYQAARAENYKRREELNQIRADQALAAKLAKDELRRKKAAGEVPYTLTERIVIALGKALLAFFKWCGEFLIARTKNVKGGSVKMVSGLGVFWLTMKAMKEGVCPLVEFVEEEPDRIEEVS